LGEKFVFLRDKYLSLSLKVMLLHALTFFVTLHKSKRCNERIPVLYLRKGGRIEREQDKKLIWLCMKIFLYKRVPFIAALPPYLFDFVG
jgi:hypothetical protein